MVRKIGLLAVAALLVAGCGDRGYRVGAPPPSPLMMDMKERVAETGAVFSYTHSLALLLPAGGVKANFELARDTCLHQAALQCELMSASLSSNDTGAYAAMTVALPHDQVERFEKTLADAGASVQSRATNAENVTTAAADTDRKIAQLTAWRDRLAALAKRTDLSVSDLMKVEAELSKVEADLGAALAAKRDLDGHIAKETVTVSFAERESAVAPVGRAFANAGATLIDSTAAAIEFLIRIVPWLPIILGGLWLARWLWSKRKRSI